MTQEISGYLLIRSYLMVTPKDTLIKLIGESDEEYFKTLIHNIYTIMEKEDFVLMYKEVEEKIDSILLRYRFNYIKNKEINDEMNFIIGKLNQYKNLTVDEIFNKRKEFCKQEFKRRSLPSRLCAPANIENMIMLDGEMVALITGLSGETEYVIDLDGILSYLSIVNIMINEQSEYFLNSGVIDESLERISQISVAINDLDDYPKFRKIFMEYCHKTLKNIKKVQKKKSKIKIMEIN